MPPRICLNMIVKDEVKVIRRCLESVRPFIDSWAIVDTGSTDGTQGLVRELMKDMPGELFERPWVNFGHNRSEAITLARDHGEFLFMIDADNWLELPAGFERPALTHDAYAMLHQHSEIQHWRVCLVATRLPWRYVGVLHEYLDCGGPSNQGQMPGPCIVSRDGGSSSRGADPLVKYANDARILEAALLTEPGNARYVFYLAQSYRDCGQIEKSLANYLRRASMGGWAEEVFYALYQAARLSERLGLDSAVVTQRYLEAYQYRPVRTEPLVELARFHRERHQLALAHLYSTRAVAMPRPADVLFIDGPSYGWRAKDEYAIACYWVNEHRECARVCRELLAGNELPEGHRGRVAANLAFAEQALGVVSAAGA